MPFIRAFFAILAAIVTVVAVVAVKRSVEWELRGVSNTTLDIIIAVMGVAALAMIGWTYLLRPMLERRQSR